MHVQSNRSVWMALQISRIYVNYLTLEREEMKATYTTGLLCRYVVVKFVFNRLDIACNILTAAWNWSTMFFMETRKKLSIPNFFFSFILIGGDESINAVYCITKSIGLKQKFSAKNVLPKIDRKKNITRLKTAVQSVNNIPLQSWSCIIISHPCKQRNISNRIAQRWYEIRCKNHS